MERLFAVMARGKFSMSETILSRASEPAAYAVPQRERQPIRGGVLALLCGTALTACASSPELLTANTQASGAERTLAQAVPETEGDMSGIAIRYPASIELADNPDLEATYARMMALTDANLTSGRFFVQAGDVTDETKLGAFFIRSTLRKSRLAAHALQTNMRKSRPGIPVFLEPMALTIHPHQAGRGDCFYKGDKDAQLEASYCLEAKPASFDAPTPTAHVIDVAAFNDYNVTTYGLNGYRSLGHEISPMIALGTLTNGQPRDGQFTFYYADGVKGSIPDDTAHSAFNCLFQSCKTKPKGKSKATKQKPLEFAEDNIFAALAPHGEYLVGRLDESRRGNAHILASARPADWWPDDIKSSEVPALSEGVADETALAFLSLETEFRSGFAAERASLYQEKFYPEVLSDLDGEQSFALELRGANKGKRVDSVFGMLGAAASLSGAAMAADGGNSALANQMLSNMDLFTTYIELGSIETDAKMIDLAEEARYVDEAAGAIQLQTTVFDGEQTSVLSIAELRDKQRAIIDAQSRRSSPETGG
jgi:hypothetical protein